MKAGEKQRILRNTPNKIYIEQKNPGTFRGFFVSNDSEGATDREA